jgi:hypothetical protein
MKKIVHHALSCSSALMLFTSSTQAELVDDSQLWSNITLNTGLGVVDPRLKNFRFWLDGQGRFGNNFSDLSQGQIRPGLGYSLSDKTTVWLGYVYTFTSSPFAKRDFDEHRIWQQFLWTQPTKQWGTLTSRTRLEQRFAETGNDVAWRVRQMFKISWPIPFNPSFSLVASDEVFVNLSNADWGPNQGLDQNRAFVGAGYNFDKHIKTEIGYMNQFIDRPVSPDRMDHILSVNLLLNY